MSQRKIIQQLTLEPATGKALPVKRGQVLRITQTGNGQCLDFNAYNLDDYKEVFHCGRTRTAHGLNPGKGSHLWSAPPRERPMFTVLEDTVGANDVNFPRCSAFLYETQFGFDGKVPHSNCHDILSEAIREYGLTPDDVHDSFNGFMNTGVRDGKLFIAQQRAIRGDYIELLVQMDVLAVPACCGADLMPTSNYELKGLEVTIFEGTKADQKLLLEQARVNQRTPDDFRQPVIKSDRPLYRDDTYEPEWPWLEAVKERHTKTVTLNEREMTLLKMLRNDPDFATFSDAEIVKYAFFDWYLNSFVQ
jgi:hypothetical protein